MSRRKPKSSMGARKIVERLYEVFERWLTLPNYDTIEVVAATYLANKISGQRLWLGLIGPSSCGKTTFAQTLLGLPNVHALDLITTGTFSSGYRKEGGSKSERQGLFEKLNDGNHHMIIVPDFSTILKDAPHAKNKALAQLRRIYDGGWNSHYGTGVEVKWEGKIGMIICCTPNYEREIVDQSTFGERFLLWKMPQPNQLLLAERAMRNSGQEDKLREELEDAMVLLNNYEVPEDVTLPSSTRDELSKVCVFVAKARTPIPRERFSKQIEEVPVEESTSRLGGQLAQLMKGLLILHGETEPQQDDFEIVEGCAYCCIPNDRLRLMGELAGSVATTRQLEEWTGMPPTVVRRTLEDLKQLGLVYSQSVGREGADKRQKEWTAAPEWKIYFHRTRQITKRARGEETIDYEDE